jgi:predicted Zn-dependent protease
MKVMGWKSTVDITREQAISLATKELAKKIGEIHTMSDTQLEDYLEELGYGETQGMEYFGNNFRIVD